MAQDLNAPRLHFGHHSCDYDMSSNPCRVPIAAFVASAGFHKLQTRFGNVLTQVADHRMACTGGIGGMVVASIT